jgi:hypothetical protein
MKYILLGLFLLLFSVPAYAITLFGYNFDDDAFSDNANYISGDIDYWGFSKWGYTETGDDNIDLDSALNGSDLYTGIEGQADQLNNKSHYIVEIEFIDNYLFNGPGVDLIVWERGAVEPIRVSLFDPISFTWTVPNYYTPIKVGDLNGSVDISSGVNVASVDFSHWNLSSSVPIHKIRLIANFDYASPDIAAFGGLNSRPIPEPSTLVLFGLGLLGFLRKSKH